MMVPTLNKYKAAAIQATNHTRKNRNVNIGTNMTIRLFATYEADALRTAIDTYMFETMQQISNTYMPDKAYNAQEVYFKTSFIVSPSLK